MPVNDPNRSLLGCWIEKQDRDLVERAARAKRSSLSAFMRNELRSAAIRVLAQERKREQEANV